MGIHSAAIVEPGAVVHASAAVWHFAHIMGGATVGEEAMIGQGVFVGPGVTIGARSRVQNFANLPAGIVLEEDVFIGPHVTFTNIKYPRAFRNQRASFVPTIVHRGASIGAAATVLPGAHVGAFAMVGAGAVVSTPTPNYALLRGVPARRVGWVSERGCPLVPHSDGYRCPESGKQFIEVRGVLLPATEASGSAR